MKTKPCKWDNETFPSIAAAAEALGVNYNTMLMRVRKGYTSERDLATPHNSIPCYWNGEWHESISAAARRNYISEQGMARRLRRGYRSDKDMPQKERVTMFTRSAIGAKCACDAPETVCKEDDSKRYLVPAGSYGDSWQPAGYYLAVWWELHCERCGNRRQDFFVYKWHHDGSGSLVDGSFPRTDRKRRYPDIYKAILQMMPK